jgi:MFS family permease
MAEPITAEPVEAGVVLPEPRTPFAAWLGLGVLTVLAFVGYLDRQVIALVVGPMEHDLHISDTQIGLLQGAAFALAYPLFAVPIGYAADRYSRPLVIFCSVLLWSFGAAVSGLAGSFGELFAARMAVGLGEAAVTPTVGSLLAEIFPKRKLATIFSVYGSGSVLGAGGALWLGEAVLEWAKHGVEAPILGRLAAWQVAFLVTGAPAAFLALLVFLAPEPRRRARAERAGRATQHPPWSEVFAFTRQTWAYLVCMTLGQTCLWAISVANLAWLPVIMQRSFGWGHSQLGTFLALFMVFFGFPGQMANGIIVDRLFVKHADAHMRYYVFASVVLTACGLLAPLAAGPWIYLAVFAPVKALLNFSGVFGAAVQVVTPPRVRGRIFAVSSAFVMTVGTMVGPSAVAAFTDLVFHDKSKVIWSLALTTGIAVPIAGVLFALALKPMREAVARDRALDAVALRT